MLINFLSAMSIIPKTMKYLPPAVIAKTSALIMGAVGLNELYKNHASSDEKKETLIKLTDTVLDIVAIESQGAISEATIKFIEDQYVPLVIDFVVSCFNIMGTFQAKAVVKKLYDIPADVTPPVVN